MAPSGAGSVSGQGAGVRTRGRRLRLLAAPLLVLAILATGCGEDTPAGADPAQVDATEPPAVGGCRNLEVKDTAEPTNASPLVPCTEPHTAETFAAGDLPGELHDVGYQDEELDRWAYRTCSDALVSYVGADESTVMRSILSWVWFRPSEKAWDDGARWYRCDVVGGAVSKTLLDLPTTTRGLMARANDNHWMACARGKSVAEGAKVPCNKPHEWRAVTTIKVGEAEEAYPGDEAVVATTKAFCSDSVGAWLDYPSDYDYGYTWFGEAEWEAGNRRSVCWARTRQ